MFANGHDLTVQRQTMADSVSDVTLTTPSGATRTIVLDPVEAGVWRKSIDGRRNRALARDGRQIDALINVGPANPREFTEVTSTTDVLASLANATGGDARRLDAGDGPKCRESWQCARPTCSRAATGLD